MSPVIDNPQTLMLLLIVPLFLILHKLRSRPKTLTFTLLPLFQRLVENQPRPPSAFRPKRRTRAFLVGICIVCLSLAASGLHLVYDRKDPGDWLIVLDNAYSMNTKTERWSARRRIVDAAQTLSVSLPTTDRISLLTLGPAPSLSRDISPEDLRSLADEAVPTTWGGSLKSRYNLVDELTRGSERTVAVILSPRSLIWKNLVSEGRTGRRIRIPDIMTSQTGNAGIVAFDLRPSMTKADRYDLFFRIASEGMSSNICTVKLYSGDTVVRSWLITLNSEGRRAVLESDLALVPGPVRLVLAGRDLLEEDNTVTAFVRGAVTVPVRLTGDQGPFIQSAVASNPAFLITTAHRGAVQIIQGTRVPEKLEAPSLIIDPRANFLSFRYTGISENPDDAVFEPFSPLTRHISFRNFRPSRTTVFKPPDGIRTLARAGEIPVVMAGEVDGIKTVVWAFNPMEGALALDPSFVMLLRTSIEWLSDTEPVMMSPGVDCGSEMEAYSARSLHPAGSGNILCEQTTMEAAMITLPGPTPDPGTPLTVKIPTRKDLSTWLLVPALFVLLYLVTADILAGKWERSM